MEYGELKIEQPLGKLGIQVNFTLNSEGEIWQTIPEIARNFDCFLSAVYSNVRIIFKNNELYKEDVCKEVYFIDNNGKERTKTLYNLDMIITLAFHIKSYRAKEFRKWIRKFVVTPIQKREILLIDTSRLKTHLKS